MMKPMLSLGWALLVGATAVGARAASWPMFRGPNGSGVAEGAKPPVQIGPDQGVLWKIDVPGSPSSPCVWGDRIFLTTFFGEKLETRAYDRSQGVLLWSQVAPAKQLEDYHATEGSPAAGTPATDGEVVVSYFGSAGLHCYEVGGKELWRHELPVARIYGGFGSGTSPLIAGDRVILSRDVMDGPAIIALDRKTGRKLWEQPRPDSFTSYSTPVVWNHDGMSEVVVAGAFSMKAYDPATGNERWLLRGLPSSTCTTPVVDDGYLFFAGWSPGKADAPFPTWESRLAEWDKNGDGMLALEEFGWGPTLFRTGDTDKSGKIEVSEWNAFIEFAKKGENLLLCVRPGGRGDITATHVAWKSTRGLPYVASPLHYEGRIYLVKDGGLASCFRAGTGEPVYLQERIPGGAGSYYASPVGADGRIYLASLQGKVTVLEAGADQPVVLHQADFGERIAATPALVGNHLYLRTWSRLYAFGP